MSIQLEAITQFYKSIMQGKLYIFVCMNLIVLTSYQHIMLTSSHLKFRDAISQLLRI